MERSQYIQNCKEELYNTDYIVLKESEGCDVSTYGDWKQKRQNLRDEINLVSLMTDEKFQEYYENLQKEVE